MRPVINGMGVVTVLGGSIMPPEVVRAMDEASRSFVQLPDLQRKAGARIAELLRVPAAMITGRAASSITVATAACIARGEPDKLRRLPDTTGMKNEVIQQKTHRSGYEAQIELVGAKVITVETQEELQNAVNERTAMMFFLKKADPLGKINRAEWVRVGKQRDVPRFNDAASDAQKSEAARKATSQRHGTLLPAATQSHWFIAHCWNPASVNCCSSMINSGAGVVLKLKQVFSCIRFFSAGEMLAAQADYNPAHLDSSARPITRPKRPAVCARA